MKPGYYVEDVYYGTRTAQARARARFLSREYRRPVDVINQTEDGQLEIVATYDGINVTNTTPQPKIYKPANVPAGPGEG